MKKIFTTVLLVLTLCFATIFAACNNDKNTTEDDDKTDNGFVLEGPKKDAGVDYTDTFKGVVSEDSYETKEEAAQDFIANEISGQAATATYTGMTKTGDLTADEIAALNTAELTEAGNVITSAEKVEVSYTVPAQTSGVAAMASSQNGGYVLTIYILVITPNGNQTQVYRYYVPKSEEGDSITKSYFEDVTAPSKYLNSTQDYKVVSRSASMGIEAVLTSEYNIKVATDKASLYLHSKTPGVSDTGYSIEYVDSYVYGYFEGSPLTSYISTDNWETYSAGITGLDPDLADCNSVQTLAMMNIPAIDFSYFEKTDFGFKIKSDFIKKYMESLLSSRLDSQVNVEGCEIYYYVSEGRIYKVTSNLAANGTNQGLEIKISVKENLLYSDFGSTTVQKPTVIVAE